MAEISRKSREGRKLESISGGIFPRFFFPAKATSVSVVYPQPNLVEPFFGSICLLESELIADNFSGYIFRGFFFPAKATSVSMVYPRPNMVTTLWFTFPY